MGWVLGWGVFRPPPHVVWWLVGLLGPHASVGKRDGDRPVGSEVDSSPPAVVFAVLVATDRGPAQQLLATRPLRPRTRREDISVSRQAGEEMVETGPAGEHIGERRTGSLEVQHRDIE